MEIRLNSVWIDTRRKNRSGRMSENVFPWISRCKVDVIKSRIREDLTYHYYTNSRPRETTTTNGKLIKSFRTFAPMQFTDNIVVR